LGGAVTIGIAAFGERAGKAVIDGLAAAEAVGHGALHGFVSFVAIGSDGRLHRLEIQTGGAGALQAREPIPDFLAEARWAALMSSGPNRPAPLSQFTVADPDVGLITGHRFPHALGVSGRPMNLDALALMRRGLGPEAALARIIAANPHADAGFIALSRDGQLHAQDAPYLLNFGDAGNAVGRSGDGRAQVAVLHNAISPHRSLANLVVDVALSAMTSPRGRDVTINFRAGVTVFGGDENAIHIDEAGRVEAVRTHDKRYVAGSWSFGLGYRTPVYRRDAFVGRALYEPYLSAEDGKIASIDGRPSIELPICVERNGPQA
jgi:hypothetical protein